MNNDIRLVEQGIKKLVDILHVDIPVNNMNKLNDVSVNPLVHATNTLYYGVPGSGKSYKVDEALRDIISENITLCDTYSRRVVFHPEYTYSDFVGQIMPVVKHDSLGDKLVSHVEYEFVPGPFTEILQKAYENQDKNCVLVIEELNRGNAAAIFGDLFQLLDRDDNGASKYGISNCEIAKVIYLKLEKFKDKNLEDLAKIPVRIPSNLSIYATMNTSDQNVFTLDTAFQRRWNMEYIENVFDEEHAKQILPNSKISWKAFAETVNTILVTSEESIGMSSTEDKGLGAYFARGKDFEDTKRFAEKVLKYLWDDAFKMNRDVLFKKEIKTLSQLIKEYKKVENGYDGLEAILLKDDVVDHYATMQAKMKQDSNFSNKQEENITIEENND